MHSRNPYGGGVGDAPKYRRRVPRTRLAIWLVGVPLLAGLIAVTDVAITQSHFQVDLNPGPSFLTQITPTPRLPIVVHLSSSAPATDPPPRRQNH